MAEASTTSTNNPAIFSNPGYNGVVKAGNTIRAVISITDADGASAENVAISWYTSSGGLASDFALIDGSVTAIGTIAIQEDWVGQELFFAVALTDNLGNLEKSWSQPGGIYSVGFVGEANNPVTGEVQISGSPFVNGILEADLTAVSDADGLGILSYIWKADGQVISGETASQLAVNSSLLGKEISLTVSYTDALGSPETLTSEGTNPVTDPRMQTVMVQRGVVGKGAGEDTYVVSANLLQDNQKITLTDTGQNTIQFASGLEVVSAKVAASALLLTMGNGAEITVLDAQNYNYVVGGDVLSGVAGNEYVFADFVSTVLGSEVPTTGLNDVAGTIIGSELAQDFGNVTVGEDTVVLQRGVVGKGAQHDTYVLSNSLLDAGAEITLSDTGSNTLQIIDGLQVSSSLVAANALMLTMQNGAVVTVLDAADYSYQVGGNPVSGVDGVAVDYAAFTEQVLGVSVPVGTAIATGGGRLVSSAIFSPPNEVQAVSGEPFVATSGPDVVSLGLSSGGQFEVVGFDPSFDTLILDQIGSVEGGSLYDVVGDIGLAGEVVSAFDDPFSGATIIAFGPDAAGELVTLTLDGIALSDLSSIQVDIA